MITRLALNMAIAVLPAVVFVFGATRRTDISPRGFYRAFLAGLVAVFPALAVMLLVSSALAGVGGLHGGALRAFVVAGLVEEVVKLAPVRWSMRRADYANSHGERGLPARAPRARAAGIAVAGARIPAPEVPRRLPLAVTAGLGFAFLENAFYLAGSSSLLVMRALLAVPLHGATAAYLGLAVAPAAAPRGSDRGRAFYSVPAAIGLAAVVHGAYDLAVKRAAPLAPLVVLAAVALAVILARHARRSS